MATFLLPEQLPSPTVEQARYDEHNNDPHDERYRAFLHRLADPVLDRLGSDPRHGLDFGSGPEPVLAAIFRASGHIVACYDPFYAPDPAPLSGCERYDFITCCEVAEHLHDSAGEFERLAGLLRPGGILGIMTEFQTDDARFAEWYYREDRTHVVFFQAYTLMRLAERLGMRIEIPRRNVAILTRPSR